MSSKTHGLSFWRRGAVVAACCAFCVCLASCGVSAGPRTLATTPATIPATTPATTSATIPAGVARAGFDQNGATIILQAGQTLILTLPTTYWTIQGSSNTQALAPNGAPVASPAPVNSCSYGGCWAVNGSVSAVFHAVAVGTATVSAS
ncbi:MAG TPA: hypothetical protein VJN88_09085, partial [Ktedonobacterales bacterium]|nr:hypothetical protein [Ktedonobacterales bacterium]